MEIRYSTKAIEDIEYWKRSGRKQIQDRITKLLQSIEQTPYSGIGSPEQLKYNFSSFWSRRIDKGNRLIYKVYKEYIEIYSLKGHYSDK